MKKVLLLLVLTFACLFGLVACGEPTPEPAENEGLKNAVSYVKNLYIAQDGKATAADYIRASQVTIENEVYTLTWTVEVTTGKATDVVVGEPAEGKVTITVNSKTSSEVVYKLHVKVTAPNGDHDSLTFNHTVPAYKSSTYAEYKEAEDGTALVVEGIVSAIFSKAEGASYEGLYLNAEDNSGAFYIYSLAEGQSLEGIEEGMKVRASGEKKTHNGTEELVTASLEVVDTNKTTITPVDLTEAYKAAADLKADSLVGKQALLVTVKGVTVCGQESGSGYYKFALAGKESYVRVSGSVCPIPKADQAGFISTHAEKYGWIANVTGVVSVYDGKFYLTPVDANAFEYVSVPTLTETEAVEWAKTALDISDLRFKDGATVELPTLLALHNVNISWASNNAAIAIEGGVATVVAGTEDVTVTLTATISKGGETATVTFEVVVKGVPVGVPTEIELTDVELGLGAYAASTATVAGVAFEWTELGSYGNGIQMRIKEGRTAKLWNTAALPSVITSIELVYNSEKNTYDNADALSFKFGSAANALTEEVKLSTVAGTKTYTVTPTGEHTYFSIELLLSYTFYWDSITINLKPVVADVELTDEELGLGAYAASTATVGGVAFEWTELGSYGNGIQMRIKEGRTAKLWNTTAFAGVIEKIELVYNSEKNTYDNADALSFKFGSAANALTEEVKLSTVAGTKTYTVTPTGEHTYFSMELLLSYTFYWDSITIYLK